MPNNVQAIVLPRLTIAQRTSIFPGPGNPDYASGPYTCMKALERRGIVKEINRFSTGGKRGALLTSKGQKIRALLAREEQDLAEHGRLAKLQERKDALNAE